MDDEGRVTIGKFDFGAHLREGFADALHGAAAEGGISGEGEWAGRVGDLGREEAGEHAHRRA